MKKCDNSDQMSVGIRNGKSKWKMILIFIAIMLSVIPIAQTEVSSAPNSVSQSQSILSVDEIKKVKEMLNKLPEYWILFNEKDMEKKEQLFKLMAQIILDYNNARKEFYAAYNKVVGMINENSERLGSDFTYKNFQEALEEISINTFVNGGDVINAIGNASYSEFYNVKNWEIGGVAYKTIIDYKDKQVGIDGKDYMIGSKIYFKNLIKVFEKSTEDLQNLQSQLQKLLNKIDPKDLKNQKSLSCFKSKITSNLIF